MSKERPISFSDEMVCAILAGKKTETRRVCKYDKTGAAINPCKYGEPGDTLWVRHSHWQYKSDIVKIENGEKVAHYNLQAWDELTRCSRWPNGQSFQNIDLAAYRGWKKKPAMFMPRWASLISLRVLSVESEPLWSITDEDAVREGVGSRDEFVDLWQRINGGKRGKDWHDNPKVWVVRFEVMQQPGAGGNKEE